MKQNKKAKICFVIYIAGIFFFKFLCYEVFAKQKKTELSMNNYSRYREINTPKSKVHTHGHTHQHSRNFTQFSYQNVERPL
jgi:hypothetical protein